MRDKRTFVRGNVQLDSPVTCPLIADGIADRGNV
jgi:hypothetical protein